MNKSHGLLALTLLLGIIVGLFLYTQYKNNEAIDDWTEHANSASGYSVSYPKDASLNQYFLGSEEYGDSSNMSNYSYTYAFNTGTENDKTIGSIQCPDTEHTYSNLNNELTIKEYAEKLYNSKLQSGLGPISKPVAYNTIKSHNNEPSYTFVVYKNDDTYPNEPSVMQYIITENQNGVKCTISYNVFDKSNLSTPDISEIRTKWLSSFKWLP